jgi:hypothetical protein
VHNIEVNQCGDGNGICRLVVTDKTNGITSVELYLNVLDPRDRTDAIAELILREDLELLETGWSVCLDAGKVVPADALVVEVEVVERCAMRVADAIATTFVWNTGV